MKQGRKTSRFDKEKILDAIIKYFAKHKESPTQYSHDEDIDFPSRGAIRKHFGTFREAMKCAGLPLRPAGSANPHNPANVNNPLHKTRKYRHGGGKSDLRDRFSIFERDGFACRYCGRTTNSGAILEIDHLVPMSRGGNDNSRQPYYVMQGMQ